MSTNTSSDGLSTRTPVDEEFLDLLLGEDDLVRAEFDAIIAAEWPDPPRPPSYRGAAGGGRRRGGSKDSPSVPVPDPPKEWLLLGERPRRQRSPPR